MVNDIVDLLNAIRWAHTLPAMVIIVALMYRKAISSLIAFGTEV